MDWTSTTSNTALVSSTSEGFRQKEVAMLRLIVGFLISLLPLPVAAQMYPGIESAEYVWVQGRDFRADWQEVVVPNESRLMEVIEELGPFLRDEFVDDEHWIVYEYEEKTITIEADAAVVVHRAKVRGKRLRLLCGGPMGAVVTRWVFEEWGPSRRFVESSEHWAERQASPVLVKSREAVMFESLQTLNAAGIVQESVRRMMIDNALEAHGYEPLTAEEARTHRAASDSR